MKCGVDLPTPPTPEALVAPDNRISRCGGDQCAEEQAVTAPERVARS